MTWEIVIGLEVHTQLSTSSKIFSSASTAYGAEPNTQADAVSIALPGVLPVLNKGAVERAIKFGLATGAHIAPRSVFARKNYFYPDLPKGYQISQMDLPVVGQGALTIQVEPLSGPSTGSGLKPYEKVVRITRAHLEEDAGKSIHGGYGQGGYGEAPYGGLNSTGIDLNRAGTPLLEIVSEPDMCSAAEAVAYAKKLYEVVTWNEICDGNMQEGSFRCDVNVSVRRPGEPLGTRREIKNLNSFKFMQQAIDYEVQWQIDTLENGGKIHQATVLFNPDTGETRMMRSKEDAHDYRYFPDPDLLPLDISPEWIESVRATLPEPRQQMVMRFEEEYGCSKQFALLLTSNLATAMYFDKLMKGLFSNLSKLDSAKLANWVMLEIAALINERGFKSIVDVRDKLPPQQIILLITRIVDGTLSHKLGKIVLEALLDNEVGNSVDQIIEAKGLKQVSDAGAIEKIVDEIIAANVDKVAEYRSGKDKLFGFFVGLAMKASKGQANPAQLNDVLKKKLAG